MTEKAEIINFTGIWIPKNIWFDSEISVMEKFFYAEAVGLSALGKKGCYAGNSHFTKILGVSTARISQLIKSLSDKKYMTVKLFYKAGTKQVSRREILPIKSYPMKKHKTDFTVEELENIDDTKRDFQGVWIPRELLFDSNINKLQMAMIVEISSLSFGDLGCFASNKHLANFLGCKSSRASQLISDLESKKYIETKKFYNPDKPKQVLKREIYLLNKFNGVLNKFDDPTYKTKSPYLEKYKEREPGSDNQLSNNTVGQPDCVIPYQKIINHLNSKTNKQFQVTTPKTRNFINQRWADGFRFDDFKKVIDNKLVDWLNDPTRNIYLRPQTLFGPNFESYLNEKTDIPMGKRTGRQPIVEVGTDWNAPEHQANALGEKDYEAKQIELNKKLAEMRAKNPMEMKLKNDK